MAHTFTVGGRLLLLALFGSVHWYSGASPPLPAQKQRGGLRSIRSILPFQGPRASDDFLRNAGYAKIAVLGGDHVYAPVPEPILPNQATNQGLAEMTICVMPPIFEFKGKRFHHWTYFSWMYRKLQKVSCQRIDLK